MRKRMGVHWLSLDRLWLPVRALESIENFLLDQMQSTFFPGSFKDFMTDMAITTTSVSLALIIKALLPSIAACHACTKIRGSDSLCIHGAKSSNAITRLQQTYSKHENGKVQSCCCYLSESFSNFGESCWLV